MKKIGESLEKCRVRHGPMGSSPESGNNGVFVFRGNRSIMLLAIVSDGGGWEHVSVRPLDKQRCCYWDEMCFVKDLFWEEDEAAVQYHPPKSQYVNDHPYVLHLWKPIGDMVLPLPPTWMVGWTSGVANDQLAKIVPSSR